MDAGIVVSILAAGVGLTALVLGAGVIVGIRVAGAGLTALMLGAGVIVGVLVAGVGIVVVVLVASAGAGAGLAVAIIFAGVGCLAVSAVGAVSAGSFVISAWLVIAVAVTQGWLDLGMVAVAALGGEQQAILSLLPTKCIEGGYRYPTGFKGQLSSKIIKQNKKLAL